MRRVRAMKKVSFLFKTIMVVRMRRLRGPSLERKHCGYLRKFMTWKAMSVYKLSEERALGTLEPYIRFLGHKIQMENSLLYCVNRVIYVQRRVKCFIQCRRLRFVILKNLVLKEFRLYKDLLSE